MNLLLKLQVINNLCFLFFFGAKLKKKLLTFNTFNLMKAQIKLINHNGCSPIEVFNSVKELKTYLNECLYYANELYLDIECNYTDNWEYSKITDLRSLLSEAKFYDSVLCVNVEY